MRTQAEQIAALTRDAERLGLGISVIARLVAHVVEAEARGRAAAGAAVADLARGYDQGASLSSGGAS